MAFDLPRSKSNGFAAFGGCAPSGHASFTIKLFVCRWHEINRGVVQI